MAATTLDTGGGADTLADVGDASMDVVAHHGAPEAGPGASGEAPDVLTIALIFISSRLGIRVTTSQQGKIQDRFAVHDVVILSTKNSLLAL